MEWILYTIFFVHYSLKHTAVILVSPDEDFWDGSQGFHQQTPVSLSHSLILAQQTMEISIKREDILCTRIPCITFSHIMYICLNKSRKKCNVLNKNEYYLSICIIGANIRHFIIGKSTCTCICILSCIMLCKEMWWAVTC